MRADAIDVPTLAEDLVRMDRLFDRRDARVALALYQLLAEGASVSDGRVAARADRSASEAAESWCAGDALLMHDLLDGRRRGHSTDPITGEPLSLSLDDGRVRHIASAIATLSMMRPDRRSWTGSGRRGPARLGADQLALAR